MSDVSQPSLGIENEHGDRMTTPPLSPMYSSDGQTIHHARSKSQSLYGKPSSGTSMETHWEEVPYTDKRWERRGKITEFNLDGDDTESELIVIPESDMSDSTLQESVHNSFEETPDDIYCPLQPKGEKVYATVKIQKPYDTSFIGHRDTYRSYTRKSKTSSVAKPTWIIGSEDESPKSWENNKFVTHEDVKDVKNNHQNNVKNCSKISTSDAVNSLTAMPSVSLGKSSTSNLHKQLAAASSSSIESEHQNKPIGKQKKIVEPSITPVCTPVSDCEDCYKNSHAMLPASIERLLPIGSTRSHGKHLFAMNIIK